MSIKKVSTILLATGARTADPDDIVISQANDILSKGSLVNLHIIIDVTAITDTPIITPTLIVSDPASSETYDLLAGIAAISTVSTVVLKVGKDIVAAAGLAAQDFIPENVTLKFAHTDADSITYSVGMNAELEI